jgi:hypothetical protein
MLGNREKPRGNLNANNIHCWIGAYKLQEIFLSELSQKDDACWRANMGILPSEGQQASLPVDTKRSDLVAALIASV